MPPPQPPPGPGEIAVGVARARAAESARPDALFEDALAEAFADAAAPLEMPVDEGPGEPTVEEMQRLRRIGSAWVVIRTMFLDGLVVGANREGCSQLVMLGAGLDTRAFRLDWQQPMHVFELETPEMFEFKEDVIARSRASAACERTLVPVDLRGDWPTALLEAGFEPSVPTVWLAEGVFAFFTDDENDQLVARTSELSAPTSRFALTIGNKDAPRERLRSRLRPLARSRGTDDPKGWLARHGWRAVLIDPAGPGRVYERWPDDLPIDAMPRAWLVHAVRHDRPSAEPTVG